MNEAGLPQDAGVISKGDLTLETLLEEKRTFDLRVKFEKLGNEDVATGWRQPGEWIAFLTRSPETNIVQAPEEAHFIDVLPTSSNLLSVAVEAIEGSQYVHSLRYHLGVRADQAGMSHCHICWHRLQTGDCISCTLLHAP